MRFSVVVPVLNEAPTLGAFLRHLRQAAPFAEIIVVDGKSEDASLAQARGLADQCVQSSRGRGAQMNAGAALATGDVLWFVHADSIIAPNSIRKMEEALADGAVAGGCFRLHIASPRWVFRVRDAIANFLVDLSGIALGDRGIFCRREIFARTGGYPEIALLEDGEFYRALKQCGRVVQLEETIGTSARRYDEVGTMRTMLFYALIMLLYVMHVPLHILERMVAGFMNKRTTHVANARRALPEWEGRPGVVPK